jgi:hypothetical protein
MEAADAIKQAEQAAEQQKQAGARKADDMAKAVHGAAEQLQQQMPRAAEFANAAASQLERGADALRERNVGDLVNTFRDFGRKEPLALFGGAVLAGFAFSRFFKSSTQNPR